MENANTYKAILLGSMLLLGGCFTWLVISRNEISSINSMLDQSRLKYETLLSEKLLVDKAIEKKSRKLDTAHYQNSLLDEELRSARQKISANEVENSKLRGSLRKSLEMQFQTMDSVTTYRDRLRKSLEIKKVVKSQRDNIVSLQQQFSILQNQYDEALQKSIDQTLVIAERRNDKITSKAKRTKELVAQVELPAVLNDLTFTVERPDGSVLSTEATISARQIVMENSVTASSLNGLPINFPLTKKMEIVYKPTDKLKQGTYVFKIFNGSDYIGSMNVRLR
jgi:hypothetical protein